MLLGCYSSTIHIPEIVVCLARGCLLKEGVSNSSSRQATTPAKYAEGTLTTNKNAVTRERGCRDTRKLVSHPEGQYVHADASGIRRELLIHPEILESEAMMLRFTNHSHNNTLRGKGGFDVCHARLKRGTKPGTTAPCFHFEGKTNSSRKKMKCGTTINSTTNKTL